MKRTDLLIGAVVAAALHAGVFSIGSLFSEPALMMQQGESVITLRLLPSRASKAAVQSQPEQAHKETPPEPKPKRRLPKVTKLIAFKHPEVLPPDELAFKVKAAAEEPPMERPDLEPELKNPLVTVEDLSPPKRVRAKSRSKPKHHPTRKHADAVNSKSSKEVEADTRTKGVTVEASIIGTVKPRYPSSCRRRGCEGRCVFEFTVLPDGTCTDIRLIKSAGCPNLDEAARQALLKTRFSPAKRFGVPVPSRKKLAFRFSLEDYY